MRLWYAARSMNMRLSRAIKRLDLEERLLNAGALVAIIGVFLPWIGGGWIGGEEVTYSGLGFFTAFLGWGILLLSLFTLLITLIPLMGGSELVRKDRSDVVRLFLMVQALVLTIAALSVFTRVTLEFSRMEIRFGVYTTLVGCVISTLYVFLRVQHGRRREVQELFHQPKGANGGFPPSEPEEH